MLATEARTAGTYANWDGDPTEDLHLNCPDFLGSLDERGARGGFTRQCESRLDQEFLDKIPMSTPMYAKDRTLTLRHVFDEPLVKRQIVLETLLDPDCMTSDIHPPSNELADRCNANFIADYAALKYECAGGLPITHRLIENGIEALSGLSLFDRFFDSDSYWEQRWRLEYGYFNKTWIVAKCAGVSVEAFASLGVFENAMDIGGTPAQGEEDWWWVEQGYEAYKLTGVAARLSNNYVQIEYGFEKDTLSGWQRVQPVMAELLKVKDPGEFQSSSEEKAARLKHFIVAQTWMKMRRVEVNKDWLLEQVGEFSDEELKQAAEEATAMTAKQGVGETWF